MNENIMILNDINIGISEIELDKDGLHVTDKSGKYSFHVHLGYNWKDINSVKVGKKENINFNEYYLSENNESALIWPSKCYVEKITNDSICFYLKFENLFSETQYMNKRNCFDIELNSLEIKVFIGYKDVVGDSIIYKF